MKTTLRAVLALGLLVGFYLLVLAVVAGDAAILVVFVAFPTSGNQAAVLGIPTNAMTSIGASAPLLTAIFYGVFTVSRPNQLLAGSVLLRRSQAPELWETVADLAEKVGTRPPTQIRLIGDANAMVTEESYLLGLFSGPSRLLYIGAPLLVGLRTDELRAVLSHELGHYARKHTRLAAIVYRGSASLSATLERLFMASGGGGRGSWSSFAYYVHWLLARYAWLYHRLAFAVNRHQELEADAAAARIVGAGVIAEALRAVHAITVSWQTFDAQILAPMRRSGRLPDDPFSAYQTMLEDPYYSDQFARLRYEIPQEPEKPFDSHPSVATRLHTLGGLPATPVNLDPHPALNLFEEYQEPFERVSSRRNESSAKPMPWRDWLILAAETRAIEPARALNRAESRLSATSKQPGPLLAAVLNRLEAGQSHALAQHLDDALGVTASDIDIDNGDPDRLLLALLSLVGQGFVKAGKATWHLSWTGASVLVLRGATADELIDWLAAAVRDPLEVPRLRLQLASLGLDVHAPIALSSNNTQSAALRVKPSLDVEAKQRQRKMVASALVVLFGLFIVLAIVANVVGAKRSQDSTTAFPVPSPQDPYYGYTAPAYPRASPLSSYVPYRIPLPTYLPKLPLVSLFPTTGTSTIVVRSGDTLTSIAQGCDSTVAALQRINDMGSSTQLDTGQTLKVPGIGGFLLPATCH